MSARLLAQEACRAGSGCPFPAPSADSFYFPPLFSFTVLGYQVDFTKPMFYCVVATVVIAVALLAAFARPKLVPRGYQNVIEWIYDFVRFDIARDNIGKEGAKWAPYLATLFLFVLLLNFFEILPGVQFPVTSHIAYPAALAILTWVIYNFVGIRRHGFLGYLKHMTVPPDLPKGMYGILTPLEFFSNILIRPFTLAIRLFGNMFAGHLMMLLFTMASFYFLTLDFTAVFAVGAGIMTFVLTAFELLIIGLQAYIFALLTAMYIGGALETEH